MKRTHDNPCEAQPPKRSKASQACQACRKNKTRCELLDAVPQPGGNLRCHRCKVLGVTCSFENSSIIHLAPAQSSSKQTILINDTRPARPPSPPSRHTSYSASPPDGRWLSSGSSSSSHSEPIQSPDLLKMEPEDLVPSLHIPWGPSASYDWTAVPLMSIRQLADNSDREATALIEKQMKEPRVETYTDNELSDILSEDQVDRLLEIYNQHYAPLLCLPPRQTERRTPLLDLVRASTAARGMDPLTRRTALPRMQKLIEETFLSKIMSSSTLSTDSIEALMILSCWPPLCPTGYKEQRDPRMLIESAVELATNLGLTKASSVRESLVAEDAGSAQLRDITDNARLWLSLTVLDSSLCIGTGTNTVSHRMERDRSFVDPTSMRNIECARDIRLGYMSEVLSLVERGCRMRLDNPSNLEKFFGEAESLSALVNCVFTFSGPLSAVTQYDKVWFEMMALQMHGWRLLLYHHLFHEIRTVMDGHNSQSWIKAEFKGIPIALSLGKDGIVSAQAILASTLALDTKLLAASPDHVFMMITFAAIWILITNFSIYQLSKINLGWASDRLVVLTAERLVEVSVTPNDLPAKCAHMIRRLANVWDGRAKLVKAPGGVGEAPKMHEPPKTCLMQEWRSEKPTSETTDINLATGSLGLASAGYTGVLPNFQQNLTQPSDLMMDAQFWATFMDNLSTDRDSGVGLSQFPSF
uniref:Zn(2)-C6 fungal-type domain-containing protein n=1 Tax=Moniliophthora roreri TaxID=221103 RepID=A0A0W0G5Y9_MONRR